MTDVTDQGACLSFAEAVGAELGTAHVNALFNNAGIGGGGSFVDGSDKGRASWEACFNINWFGVYYMTRAFMEMLQASDEGVLVNTSSVAGFWGSLGPKSPLTACTRAPATRRCMDVPNSRLACLQTRRPSLQSRVSPRP